MNKNGRVEKIIEFLNSEYKSVWEYIPEELKKEFNHEYTFSGHEEGLKFACKLLAEQMEHCRFVGNKEEKFNKDCRVIYTKLTDIRKWIEKTLIEEFSVNPYSKG